MVDESRQDGLWIAEVQDEEPEAPVLVRRPVRDDADLDITPMIDITFLLLIFFLVCSTAAMQQAGDLPLAEHGEGVKEKTSAVLTISEPEGAGPSKIYLRGGTSGSPLPEDPDQQYEAIQQYVQTEIDRGKKTVLIMAEKGVKHREVSRVAAAASEGSGDRDLHMAVMEIE